MPALNLPLPEILAELREDSNFAALPADWQEQISRQVRDNGLEWALRENASWAAENPDNPGSAALSSWTQAGTAAVESGAAAPVTPPSPVPLEQGLLDQVLPRLQADIDADVERATIADNLARTAVQGTEAATTILQRTQGGRFDGATYLRQNPDVAAAFEQQRAANPSLNIDQFAEQHYLTNGQREGRQPSYIQSAQLAQDFNNANQTVAANIAAADQAFQTNLTALQQATGAMQQNLTGALGERAAALDLQIASLTANLNQLDATQRAALAQQIGTMQADLEAAVNTQRQALADQIAALGQAATAEAAARRAALSEELARLTAAQGPLAEARVQAAELQATAVNVGLERTRDQLVADAARAGYVGGSTVQDAAMARATVDARQRAAEAIGGARTANASDSRDIAMRGATGERTIADALAAAQRDIAGQGATGNAGLTNALAQGRLQIGNFGSAGTAGISNNTALARSGIGTTGANQTYQDQVFGADQKRSLSDALATGTLGLSTNLAGQTQQAQNQGAAARATYYDNDYSRSLNAALGLTALPANLTNTLTGLGNYGNSGLNRTLNVLNWWDTGAGAAPTGGYVPVQPGNTGNDISGLGNGAFNFGTSVGAANNWWQPTTRIPSTSAAPGGINAGGANLNTSVPYIG